MTTTTTTKAKRVTWTVTVVDAAGTAHTAEILARPYARNVKRFALGSMQSRGVDLDGATVTVTRPRP